MKELTIKNLEAYLSEIYKNHNGDQGLFMKLIEEIGEVAEILNMRVGRKSCNGSTNEHLANELVDVLHYVVAIAAVNDIDLEKVIIEKDKKAASKYHRELNLETFLS